MTQRDADYVSDIIAASRLIETFVNGLDATAFAASAEKYWSTVSQVIIIGEATKNLSAEFRDAHPSIPWSEMARMRDKVIHHYRGIDAQQIWNAATRDIPHLLVYLFPFLPASGEG